MCVHLSLCSILGPPTQVSLHTFSGLLLHTPQIRVQQLAELEEVLAYKRVLISGTKRGDTSISEARTHFIKQLWRDRLKGVQRNVEVGGEEEWEGVWLVGPLHFQYQGKGWTMSGGHQAIISWM